MFLKCNIQVCAVDTLRRLQQQQQQQLWVIIEVQAEIQHSNSCQLAVTAGPVTGPPAVGTHNQPPNMLQPSHMTVALAMLPVQCCRCCRCCSCCSGTAVLLLLWCMTQVATSPGGDQPQLATCRTHPQAGVPLPTARKHCCQHPGCGTL
jgi:hypothetical protein